MRHALTLTLGISAVLAALALAVPPTWAQREIALLEPEDAAAELQRATREGQQADARAARLTREAEEATQAADKTAREAAAIAAQIQGAESRVTAALARFSIAQAERAALSSRLAARQQPLVRLTGALQTTSRRPLALSALQPGSLKDLVYIRAVLDAAVPEIRRRTSALRSELEQRKVLEQQAQTALTNLRSNEQQLLAKRSELTDLETRQRLASREARSVAARESERALALAEDARDLDGLIDQLDEAAELRRELAALSGPVLRPANVGSGLGGSTAIEPSPNATATNATVTSTTGASTRPARFQLPVQGRTIAGFGEMRDSGLRSTNLLLAPAAGAQIVAPASGRVAFAGPYRGFGRIVIIEHDGGWTSLVTGLQRISVDVGETVIAGAPMGVADNQNPRIGLELRRSGEPVNPLNFLG